MNDYLLHEMVRIRIDELREEASRARAVREARGSRGWRNRFGMLAGAWAARAKDGGLARQTVREACCA